MSGLTSVSDARARSAGVPAASVSRTAASRPASTAAAVVAAPTVRRSSPAVRARLSTVSASLGAGFTASGLSVRSSRLEASLTSASFAGWSFGMKLLNVSA